MKHKRKGIKYILGAVLGSIGGVVGAVFGAGVGAGVGGAAGVAVGTSVGSKLDRLAKKKYQNIQFEWIIAIINRIFQMWF